MDQGNQRADAPAAIERRMKMMKSKATVYAAIAGAAIFCGRSALAQPGVGAGYQDAAAAGTTVHGHVQNPVGQAITSGEVKFTTERTTPTADLKFAPNMVFPIDAQGNYKATGLKPGDYFVFFTQGGKILDREDLSIKAGETDTTLDDDMSRPEFMNSLSPEEKKQIEEYKQKNAAVSQANAQIANLNTTLKKVQADLAAAAPTKGDVSADVTDMKNAVAAKPDEPILWTNYGNTLLAQADHLAAADKASGKAVSTDTDKAIALDAASKKPNPAGQAADYNQMGNALAHAGKGTEATEAFENAVKASPGNADMYYRNEAVVLYNANQFDQAAAAADKAIASDPKDATAYYIKAQSLVTKAAPDPKTGKMVAPPGTVDAYQQFLQLAPNDPKAGDVKQMLDALGEKVQTKFKATGR
jgi:tetratricopeptide (TPR) repeat protein